MENMAGHGSNPIVSRRARVEGQIMCRYPMTNSLFGEKLVSWGSGVVPLRDFTRPKRSYKNKDLHSGNTSNYHRKKFSQLASERHSADNNSCRDSCYDYRSPNFKEISLLECATQHIDGSEDRRERHNR